MALHYTCTHARENTFYERTHSMTEHILWGGPALQVHTCERIRTRCSADVRERENSVCIGCSLGVHWVFIVRTTGTAMGVPKVVRTCVHAPCVHARMRACMRTHTCLHVRVHHAHAYMHACACMQTRMHACMCAHAHIRVCMCVCVCVCVRSQELRERAAAMQ